MSRSKGCIISDEHRKKISIALTGKKFSEEHRRALSSSHKGQPNTNKGKKGLFKHTEEAKRRIGEASKGNKYCLGKIYSDEHKQKISEKSKGRKQTQETKEKIRQANLGKIRMEMRGKNNPMHTHPNSYKSKFGKTGFREDLGVFLKSTWEANMMRLFKYLGLTVQYEPESFLLSDGRTYRPDFYIIDNDIWIEVKGRWLKDAYERFRLFCNEYPNFSIQVIGKKEYENIKSKYKYLINNWEG